MIDFKTGVGLFVIVFFAVMLGNLMADMKYDMIERKRQEEFERQMEAYNQMNQ